MRRNEAGQYRITVSKSAFEMLCKADKNQFTWNDNFCQTFSANGENHKTTESARHWKLWQYIGIRDFQSKGIPSLHDKHKRFLQHARQRSFYCLPLLISFIQEISAEGITLGAKETLFLATTFPRLASGEIDLQTETTGGGDYFFDVLDTIADEELFEEYFFENESAVRESYNLISPVELCSCYCSVFDHILMNAHPSDKITAKKGSNSMWTL